MQGEFDKYVPGGVAPTNVDIITHSVIPNRHGNFSDMTWYTAPGGGGVIDTGNASWVGQLADAPLIPTNVLPAPVPGVTPLLLRIMMNVYSVLGAGPASVTHPSTGNWRYVYTDVARPCVGRPTRQGDPARACSSPGRGRAARAGEGIRCPDRARPGGRVRSVRRLSLRRTVRALSRSA